MQCTPSVLPSCERLWFARSQLVSSAFGHLLRILALTNSMGTLVSLLRCRMERPLLEHPRDPGHWRSRESMQMKCQGCKKRISDIPCQCYSAQSIQDDARTKFFNTPELLSIVFEYSLPEDTLPTDNPLSPPCLLTQVCSSWRLLAFATPRLWARLDLVCFPSIPCRLLADRHFIVLREWLTRSRDCPISLALRYPGSSMNDVCNISRILSAILPHARRWRELSITTPMPCLNPILQLLGRDTPNLETCRINITSASRSVEREDLVVDLDNTILFRLFPITLNMYNAPSLKHLSFMTDALTDIICVDLPSSLRTLSLSNFDLLLGPPGLKLNFCCANLRKLTLRSTIQIFLLHQLSQAFPHLEDACFNINQHGIELGPESSSILNRASVQFPKLHTLVLRAVSSTGGADLHVLGLCLGALNTPSLARLSLAVGSAILQNTWTPLIDNLERVSQSLKELSFIGAYFSEDAFLATLRAVPQLENLKMCTHLTDGVLSALTPPEKSIQGENQESARILCPNLTHLDIPFASPCHANSIIRMILSRCPPPLAVNTTQESPALAKARNISRVPLQDCRLVLSQPGTIKLIEHHPDILKCVERGLRLDLRPF